MYQTPVENGDVGRKIGRVEICSQFTRATLCGVPTKSTHARMIFKEK